MARKKFLKVQKLDKHKVNNLNGVNIFIFQVRASERQCGGHIVSPKCLSSGLRSSLMRGVCAMLMKSWPALHIRRAAHTWRDSGIHHQS